jgi:hypothetical protein
MMPDRDDGVKLDDLFERFLQISQQEPFCQAMRKFRGVENNMAGGGRMSTPSAQDAGRRADLLRNRFTTAIDDQTELVKAWSLLTVDEQDSFLCRLFLPHALGGFLFALDGGGDGASGAEHQRSAVDDDKEVSDQDSENNAFLPEEDMDEISSLEGD